MTISVKHAFQSAKADGTDSTLVQPSNWNAEHTITLAAGKVLGRDSSGAGAVQELPLSLDAAGNLSMSATAYFVPAVGTTAQRPASPATGAFRYNTTAGKFEGYSGTAWGSIGGGATVSDTAPASPANGDLWWKSDEGQMYVYYTDANSSQWVVANAYAGGAAYLALTGGTMTGAITFAAAQTIAGTLLTNASVTIGKLNVTGTPDATNYLRGDGSWQTITQGQFQTQLFTSSGTWTAPTGVTKARVICIGGGGGGGGGNNSTACTFSGGSGGLAGVAYGIVTVVPGTVYTVTIGTGGTGAIVSSGGGGNAGTSGGSSSFGALISATGGGGGTGATSSANGSSGTNGTGSSGTIRNSAVGSVTISGLNGNSKTGGTSGAQTPLAFSISAIYGAGYSGGGGSPLINYYGGGGIGGVVLIEWIG